MYCSVNLALFSQTHTWLKGKMSFTLWVTASKRLQWVLSGQPQFLLKLVGTFGQSDILGVQ